MSTESDGIKFLDVGRTFITREGKELVALETVRLTVKPGEFVSIVGPYEFMSVEEGLGKL
jgi:ABC-type nitrate/sulfonate/bicarbonate transport system ATPase subunit